MKDSQVEVAGGRELAYTDIGHREGACVFFFHGAPMSRLHLVALEEQFVARRLRVVRTEAAFSRRPSTCPSPTSRSSPTTRPRTFRAFPGHGHLTIVSELPLLAAALGRRVRAAS